MSIYAHYEYFYPDSHEFSVIYMGYRLLETNEITLSCLQEPLKKLYINHKRNTCENRTIILSVTKEGLKMKNKEIKELKPFSSLMVWTSVKLVLRRFLNTWEFAFLPLLPNFETVNKYCLFKRLSDEERLILNNNNGGEKSFGEGDSILAIVMRSAHKKRQFECHGFICKSSEDAINLAIKIYETLIKNVISKKERKRVEDKKETSERMSIKMSEGGIESLNRHRPMFDAEDKSNFSIKNLKNRNSLPLISGKRISDGIEKDYNNLEEKSNCAHKKNYSSKSKMKKKAKKSILECQSDTLNGEWNREGDILTKVTIPRSSSTLNAIGPFWGYSSRLNSCKRNEITSPLGFKELFKEFQLDEGLENVDDILNVIIDAEGMSFNNLRPIYKEFLMKLALTLTKDELYQKSKIIIRRQKNAAKNGHKRNIFFSGLDFHNLTKNSLKDEKKENDSTKPVNKTFIDLLLRERKNIIFNKGAYKRIKKKKLKILSTRRSRSKINKKLPRNNSQKNHCGRTSKRKNLFQKMCSEIKNDVSDVDSNESLLALKHPGKNICDCKLLSFEFEKCPCVSHGKDEFCDSDYCKSVVLPTKTCSEKSFKTCNFDTDSCTYSNKCYCSAKSDNDYEGENLSLRRFIETYQDVNNDFQDYETLPLKRYLIPRTQKFPNYKLNAGEKRNFATPKMLRKKCAICSQPKFELLKDYKKLNDSFVNEQFGLQKSINFNDYNFLRVDNVSLDVDNEKFCNKCFHFVKNENDLQSMETTLKHFQPLNIQKEQNKYGHWKEQFPISKSYSSSLNSNFLNPSLIHSLTSFEASRDKVAHKYLSYQNRCHRYPRRMDVYNFFFS